MRSELFMPTPDGEGRLLLLIDAFSTRSRSLEGRTKLAKLDFLLRYPDYLRRGLIARGADANVPDSIRESLNIENRMVRYRYGPWDPAYFALLGNLVGRGLVIPTQERSGVGYRTTELGSSLASELASTAAWHDVAERTRIPQTSL